ncbi:MAG: pantoate--beta-alanine ligase [Methylococcaceae bacterium]|nr:pantoate--beta-alanine ligase [Methylococcaceae bacterium]
MLTVNSIAGLREQIHVWRLSGDTIAFVPTMGNLHAGHVHLVKEARRQADRVVVSIFVNPLQFGPGEDFAAYPRTRDEDAGRLRAAGADLLFMPEASAMYPLDATAMSVVEVPGLSDDLCGRFRPGHFRGVATVVLKLFNQVQPDIAVFGEKDYQQLVIIRRMVNDLDLPVRILSVPTVRETNGLAMSSRNAYLTEAERVKAALLHAELELALKELSQGRRDFSTMEIEHATALESAGFQVDYFAIRRQQDLRQPDAHELQLVILVAARLGRARLIDNLKVSLAA